MKQKGKRFYVQENTKHEKRVKKAVTDDSIVFDIDSDFDVEPDNTAINTEPEILAKDKKPHSELSKHAKRKKIKQDKKNRAKAKSCDKTKKQGRLLNSNDRRVLSYEDLPLDDSGRKRFQNAVSTVKHNRKSIVVSIVIVLLLALCVLLFANRDRLTFSNIKNWVEYGILNVDSQERFPLSTDGAVINNGNFTRVDSNLVFASDTQFVTLNSYGRTIYSTQQTYSNPVLVTASDCDLSLVYNLGGTEFSINTIDSNVYTGEVEDNILVADVSKSGTYALVTEKDGYLCKLYVYSEDNKQIYAYSFADYYITSVSLDSDGDTAVLSGVSAHDGTQISAIYVLDFTKEEPVIFEEFNNNIIYYLDHLTDNYVCIIGANATYTLNIRTKVFNTTNYDGKTLTAFDINTDTNNFVLSLSRSGDGRKCDIYTFSTSGVHKNTIATDLVITSISTYKNRVAALSGDIVYLYSKDGLAISENDAGLDPHAVVLYSTTDAYVLGVSEIRRLDL